MAPPKHLWSGDWEAESTDRAPRTPTEHTAGPVPDSGGPSAADEPRSLDAPWYRRRGMVAGLGAGCVGLIVVAVVLALTLGGHGSNVSSAQAPTQTQTPGSGGQGFITPTVPNQGTTPTQTTPQTTPQVQTPTLPAQVNAGPTYNWLGMSLNATSTGVTVGDVTPHGAADSAGVDPGDVIAEVDNTQIQTVAQLQSALRSLKLGQRCSLIVDRGSTPVTLTATLTGRPSRAS